MERTIYKTEIREITKDVDDIVEIAKLVKIDFRDKEFEIVFDHAVKAYFADKYQSLNLRDSNINVMV